MPNRLGAEHSPYLLQHQDNPVDWYPWGQEAFDRARIEDKPIFLSIGYSTCHWCHVMEHESFENPEVADVLNRHFVAIKVDREERPDVDRVYMGFVQATTGSGGWPMSVWLTPALEPFYGGTYFPPSSRWGRPGFVDILREIARVWHAERGKVEQSAATIMARLRSLEATTAGRDVPGPEVLAATVEQFAATFDRSRGGFGGAPKFPRPSELLFLLREHARTGNVEAREMAVVTLRAMARGGMRDHVGGGFHRYSVDADWRVPHFEKMLYDQAQLALGYLDAAQCTGERFYADVAADTLDYVRRDLRHPEGGFFSAEDADSIPAEEAQNPHPRRREGAFYVWRDEEIGAALGKDAEIVRLRFGVLPGGNAPADPQDEFTGQNLLYTARSTIEIAGLTGQAPETIWAALARARAILREVRSGRPRPRLDDKVLTAWNGLMIAACARAARVLEDGQRHLADAERAARFIRGHLWDASSGTLLRRYRRGEAGVEGYCEDYAYLVWGLLELFQAGGDPEWLKWALALQREQDSRFWDGDGGGWFSTTGRDASVLLRLKENYDGAEPAAGSVAVHNLLVLSHLAGDANMSAQIALAFGAAASRMKSAGRTVPLMLASLSDYHAGVPQVTIVGRAGDLRTNAMTRVVRSHYLPSAVVVPIDPASGNSVTTLMPWTRGMVDTHDPTAYVCRDFTCRTPASSPEMLAAQLDELTLELRG